MYKFCTSMYNFIHWCTHAFSLYLFLNGLLHRYIPQDYENSLLDTCPFLNYFAMARICLYYKFFEPYSNHNSECQGLMFFFHIHRLQFVHLHFNSVSFEKSICSVFVKEWRIPKLKRVRYPKIVRSNWKKKVKLGRRGWDIRQFMRMVRYPLFEEGEVCITQSVTRERYPLCKLVEAPIHGWGIPSEESSVL